MIPAKLLNAIDLVLEYLDDERVEYERYTVTPEGIDPKTHIGGSLRIIEHWIRNERQIQNLMREVEKRGEA